MIDFNRIRPCPNKYVDGQLEDGRLVEFKTFIPHNLDKLIPPMIAMANTNGGLIIFGFDERTSSIVGLQGDFNQHIRNLEQTIKKLSLGITYSLSHEEIDGRVIVILEIMESESTAYFSRVEQHLHVRLPTDTLKEKLGIYLSQRKRCATLKSTNT